MGSSQSVQRRPEVYEPPPFFQYSAPPPASPQYYPQVSPPPPPSVSNTPQHRPQPQQAAASSNGQSSQNRGHLKTNTVRNQVNLRKKSLKVEPTDDGDMLRVTFEFDASAACSVTTFFGASERPKGTQIVVGEQGFGERVFYPEKSLYNKAHRFPPEYLDELELRFHQLDFNIFTKKQLLELGTIKKQDVSFPIIVRLECLAENLPEDNTKTLEYLPPGNTLPPWVQAQTTYALLKYDEGACKWTVQVVKQKLWVNESTYLVQDIYGMEGGSGGKDQLVDGLMMEERDDCEGRECVICLTEERDTAVLPCRHFCMCHNCAQQLQKSSRQCPICRIKIGSLLQIKVERKRGNNGTSSNSEEEKIEQDEESQNE